MTDDSQRAWAEWTKLDHNVVFENMTIRYNGGPVILHNVRFINCRFEVPNSPRGYQLLASAVEQPANVQIGIGKVLLSPKQPKLGGYKMPRKSRKSFVGQHSRDIASTMPACVQDMHIGEPASASFLRPSRTGV